MHWSWSAVRLNSPTITSGIIAIAVIALTYRIAGFRWAGDITTIVSVSESDLQLGRLWIQKRYKGSLTLTNRSPHAIDVADISASCTCTLLSQNRLHIPRDGIGVVSYEVDLTTGLSQLFIESPFTLTIRATVIGGGQSRRASWTIAGTKVPSLSFSDSSLQFRVDDYNSTSRQWITRSVTFAAPFDCATVVVDHPIDDGVVALVRRTSARKGTIDITPTCTVPGSYTRAIPIQVVRQSGDALPPFEFMAYFEMPEPVIVTPQTIRFPLAAVGATLQSQVIVASRDGQRLRHQRIVSQPPESSMQCRANESGELYYTVDVVVRKLGATEDRIVCAVATDEGEEFNVTIWICVVGRRS